MPEAQKKTKVIKFEDIKQQLLDELNKRSSSGRLNLPEKVSIVDGFINQPTTMELSGSFVLGGPTIPLIMLVGKESGRIYLFALKALLPDIYE